MNELLTKWNGVFEQIAEGLPSFIERARETQRAEAVQIPLDSAGPLA